MYDDYYERDTDYENEHDGDYDPDPWESERSIIYLANETFEITGTVRALIVRGNWREGDPGSIEDCKIDEDSIEVLNTITEKVVDFGSLRPKNRERIITLLINAAPF